VVALPLAAWKARDAWRTADRPSRWLVIAAFNVVSAGCYMGALSFDKVGRIAPIVFVFPALIAGLGWLHFRYPVGRKLGAALAVGVTGTMLVFGSDIGAPSKVVGGLLAIGTAFAASYYFISAARFTSTHWLATGATIFTAGAFVYVPIAAATRSPLPHGIGWLWLAGLVVLGGVVPYLVQLSALSGVGSTKAGVLAMLEPVVAVTMAYLVLHERMSALQAAGAALVLASFVLATVRLQRRSRGSDHPLGGC
jgi:drug/metabolite transporter (DMT)-like permease